MGSMIMIAIALMVLWRCDVAECTALHWGSLEGSQTHTCERLLSLAVAYVCMVAAGLLSAWRVLRGMALVPVWAVCSACGLAHGGAAARRLKHGHTWCATAHTMVPTHWSASKAHAWTNVTPHAWKRACRTIYRHTAQRPAWAGSQRA